MEEIKNRINQLIRNLDLPAYLDSELDKSTKDIERLGWLMEELIESNSWSGQHLDDFSHYWAWLICLLLESPDSLLNEQEDIIINFDNLKIYPKYRMLEMIEVSYHRDISAVLSVTERFLIDVLSYTNVEEDQLNPELLKSVKSDKALTLSILDEVTSNLLKN